MLEITNLNKIIGYRFQNESLLQEALTHTSMHRSTKSYERLEFLGDRVLGLVIAEELFESFPHESEGNLAKRHAQLVRTETLAEIAEVIGLGEYILMGRGEANTGGRQKVSLLSDVLEALIAAIYKDGGLEPVRAFIKKQWDSYFLTPLLPERDTKTALQEYAQGKGYMIPAYTVLQEQGPPHNPIFTVEVFVEGLGKAQAQGSSKRKAEKEAAEKLLHDLLKSLR